MKKLSLHTLFWLAYIIQDALLVYTWIGPLLQPMTESKLIGVSFLSATVMVIPKLIIGYFILNVSFIKILQQTEKMSRIVIEILIMLFVSLLVYRVLSMYLVNPYIYEGRLKPVGLLDLRSILMSLMDIGAVVGLLCFIKFVRIQVSVKEREKNIIREKLETELKFLRNQTNPHFLMNTLNNIYALARRKSDETPEVVMKLSEMLRYILYEAGEKKINLMDEVKVLEDYLELEKMRYSERLQVSFEKEIDDDSYEITPLLLLPFVENAFKYGISETRFESFVRIRLTVSDHHLSFCIENSKDDQALARPSTQIGLNNVRRQLELMYRDYQLEVVNESQLFKALLTIKLDSYVEI